MKTSQNMFTWKLQRDILVLVGFGRDHITESQALQPLGHQAYSVFNALLGVAKYFATFNAEFLDVQCVDLHLL